jgi:ribosomal protein L7/L12
MNIASSKPALSSEVIEAIERGNKIEAIKLLRESTGLGLKEAKDIIDAYEDSRPAASQAMHRADTTNGGIIIVIVLAVLAYGLYKFTA